MGCVLNESGKDIDKYHRKVVSGRKVASAIRFMVNARGLQFEFARVLHEALLVPVLLYGSEVIWRKNKRSMVRAVQMELRVPNAWIKS